MIAVWVNPDRLIIKEVSPFAGLELFSTAIVSMQQRITGKGIRTLLQTLGDLGQNIGGLGRQTPSSSERCPSPGRISSTRPEAWYSSDLDSALLQSQELLRWSGTMAGSALFKILGSVVNEASCRSSTFFKDDKRRSSACAVWPKTATVPDFYACKKEMRLLDKGLAPSQKNWKGISSESGFSVGSYSTPLTV